MKDLDKLTADEMRSMLKSISQVLYRNYNVEGQPYGFAQDIQLEQIGMQFFAEGPDCSIARSQLQVL